ncbi:creatininase family protein [Halomonas faecis]|uniref:creatininase family protein n=1 Tax=Halomonas faecis TaxID=1562110 RepID=UPI0013D17A88|nr:creatininase family protein [Halomonas faecis]
MSETRFPRWQDLTSRELACLDPDSVAVAVVGAIEQHGAHLPLATDLDIGEGLLDAALERLPDDLPLVMLPSLAVGTSDEHLSFSGTLSLPPQVAIATLEALGDGVARAGLSRLVLLNGHGGNNAVIDIAALALRRRHALRVVKVHYPRLSPPPELRAALPDAEWRHGLHGGALETALMHHLAPHKVRLDALDRPPSSGEAMADAGWLLAPEGAAPFAWLAEDLHPGGVVGDATLGTAALGARLAAHYGEALARVIRETHRAPPLNAASPSR